MKVIIIISQLHAYKLVVLPFMVEDSVYVYNEVSLSNHGKCTRYLEAITNYIIKQQICIQYRWHET